MFKRVSLLAVVLALLAIVAVGAPAQAATYHGMKMWGTNTCLDEAKQNKAIVQSWHCDGGPEQHWSDGFNSQTGQYTFHNQGTNWCITAPASGAGVVTMASCDEAAATQHWTVYSAGSSQANGWYDVWKNVSSGLCLTAASVYDGYVPWTTTCDANYSYQRWHEG
jgi:hypothetical protein